MQCERPAAKVCKSKITSKVVSWYLGVGVYCHIWWAWRKASVFRFRRGLSALLIGAAKALSKCVMDCLACFLAQSQHVHTALILPMFENGIAFATWWYMAEEAAFGGGFVFSPEKYFPALCILLRRQEPIPVFSRGLLEHSLYPALLIHSLEDSCFINGPAILILGIFGHTIECYVLRQDQPFLIWSINSHVIYV